MKIPNSYNDNGSVRVPQSCVGQRLRGQLSSSLSWLRRQTLGVVDVAEAVVVMAHPAQHRIRPYLLAGLRQHAVPELHTPESTRLQLAGNICQNTFGA